MSAVRADQLRVEVLGRIRAWHLGQELVLGPPRRQAVLAVLVIRANQVVSRDEIIDAVWGDAPPASAANGTYIHIGALRRMLEPGPADFERVLVSGRSGYLLRLAPGQLDLAVFADHLDQANRRLAQGELPAAVEAFDAALALWRGTPFAGVPGAAADAQRVRLAELRLTAIEGRAEALLGLGHHPNLVAELSALAGEHPMRERLRGLLMLALYRAGRQADALAAYADTRRLLVDELGVEPGATLQRMHRAVLAGADVGEVYRLAGGPDRRPAAAAAEVMPGLTGLVPAQLPSDVFGFTGRDRELSEMDDLLLAGTGNAAAVVISAISGTAGVGKTALAVHWAHRVSHRFPDGHLYVDLRGYDPDQPMLPADALAGFLRALGVGGTDIPHDPTERAARFRTLAANRRILVLLDNAHSADQVRPLLPGTPSCFVVVTSRDSLAGLVARHGARRLKLGLLPQDNAVDLLHTLLGDRVDREPAAAAALAQQCARLPLALRIAAELVAARDSTTLADLISELDDEHRRLDLLDAGADSRTAVRAVFSWSYQHLAPSVAQAFRLLGLHFGPDIDSYAMAALWDSDFGAAERTAEALIRAHLIEQPAPGRFRMHDLLRAYATGLAAEEDETARHAAVTRLLDHYLTTAGAAMDTLLPAERHRRPPVGAPRTPSPDVSGVTTAGAWLASERVNLVSIAQGATSEHPAHVTRLARVIARYLDGSGFYSDGLIVHSGALAAAQRIGDHEGLSAALHYLGTVHRRWGRLTEAHNYYQRALDTARDAGDGVSAGSALCSLGIIYRYLGQFEQSLDHYQQALTVARDVGDNAGACNATCNLGILHDQMGRYDEALSHYHQALTIARQVGDRVNEGLVMGNLGGAYGRLHRHDAALAHLNQALLIIRELGNRAAEADLVDELGLVYERLGDNIQAHEHFRRAIEIHREIGNRHGEMVALNHYQQALSIAGDLAPAR